MNKVLTIQHIVLAFLAFACLLGITHADEPKPKTKPLSKDEQERTLKIARENYEATNTFKQVITNTLSVPLEDCAKVTAALGNLRVASERMRGIETRMNELLERQRKDNDCDNCEWTPDGRALIKPQQPTPGN